MLTNPDCKRTVFHRKGGVRALPNAGVFAQADKSSLVRRFLELTLGAHAPRSAGTAAFPTVCVLGFPSVLLSLRAGDWSFYGHSGAITINSGLTIDSPAGDWTPASSGPLKSFTTTVTVYGVQAGTYDATATVSQQGGDYTDQTSIDSVVVTNCAAGETCDQIAQPVGQVTGNKNLAKNGTPVNIIFKGTFGDTATLTIKVTNTSTVVLGPTSVSRNGDSCVYNYQWIPTNSAGAYLSAGNYIATVNGNGQTPLTFSFDLTCKSK
jgi:hypothetical protein